MTQGKPSAHEAISVVLPWPDAILSPNAHVHWSRKSRAVKSARSAAFYLVRAACKIAPGWGRVGVSMAFHPPDHRRRDRDNLIASMKAATDGIADAIGTDDSKFETTYRMGEVTPGGAVLVTLEQLP